MVRKLIPAFGVLLLLAGQVARAECTFGGGLTPSNDSTVVRNEAGTVELQWPAIAGATSYDVFFGPGPTCPGTPNATVTGTTWSPPSSQVDGGEYSWRVKANGTACVPVPESDCTTFTVAACPATGPTLISPSGTIPFGNVLLKWYAVADATAYDIHIGLDGDPPSLIGGTADTQKTIVVEPGRSVSWYAAARADGCEPVPGSPLTFTTSCPDGAPGPQGPSKGSSFDQGKPITFKWSAVAGAAGYDVKISPDGGESWNVIAENLTTLSYSTSTIPRGSYLWEVRANFNGSCEPLYSQPWDFIVESGCDTAAPLLQSPANASVVTFPLELRWSAVANATRYNVMIRRGGDSADKAATTTNTSMSIPTLPAGTYEWYIEAEFDGCADRQSLTRTFVVEAARCPTGTIALLTPAANAEASSPVRFTWAQAADVDAYRLWVAGGNAPPAIVARTTSPDASVALPAGAGLWYVEGLRSGCDSITSERRALTVSRSTSCSNSAPALIAPAGTQEAPVRVGPSVQLSWSASPGAIGYRVWIAEDGESFADVALTTTTTAQVELEDDEYAWFVQALFSGCDPVRSSVAWFEVEDDEARCGTAAPSLISPAAGTSSTSPVTFSWSPVDEAERYRVYVSLNGNEPTLVGTTEETTLTRVIPPGSVVWAVEAVFEECPSTVSPRVQFTIPRSQNCAGAAPQLSSPANDAKVAGPEITFVWTPVSGATRYALVLQAEEGAPTLVDTTTATQLTRDVPRGEIKWWVIAFFASCDPATSEKFEVEVERPSSCESRSPVLLLPAGGALGVPSPVTFSWTPVPGATSYRVWAREGDAEPGVIATTTLPEAVVALSAGRYNWFVQALFDGCPPTRSALADFTVSSSVGCGTPLRPAAQVIGQSLSNAPYKLRWTALPNVGSYEVQESTTLDFANAATLTTDDTSRQFSHEVSGEPVQYLYRVRGISNCSDVRGPYSQIVGVFIVSPKSSNSSAEAGADGSVVQKLFLPGSSAPTSFVATVDRAWLTVTPASGTLPPEGLTLTVTAKANALRLGTNTGTIQVSYTSNSGSVASNGTTVSLFPTSVSLVTPVTPGGKGTPPPDALIFPVVGHAVGANDSLFESDIRLTNLAAQTMKYQLRFTPSGTNGTTTGSSSTIEVQPNATFALDDIVATLFGIGTTTSATGTLEIRPLTTASSSGGLFATVADMAKQMITAASSRTYNFTPSGTFGQFIPAIPFSQFVGRATGGAAPSILSIQQVAQSAAYRANVGFAEAAGLPADLSVRVFDTRSTLLATIPVSLQAGEHKQINGLLAQNGITNLADGRIEVEVVGGDGKVTAYVSEVDNLTNDPLLVSPVLKGSVSASRYVVPGVAFIDNGAAFWVTDLRIFNAGESPTPATLTFYPQGNPGAPVTREITLDAGEIEVLDNVIGGLFGQANGAGGALAVTTPQNAKLTATARTYNQTTNGTYGQYIPGVTVAESVGAGDRALQILQLEQSSRFRTNIGVAETSGQPATIEIAAIVPGTITTPIVSVPLAANEFKQLPLAGFGLGDGVYNARVTVKVVSGNGKVTAYGSAIDQSTQDPTYVPAQ